MNSIESQKRVTSRGIKEITSVHGMPYIGETIGWLRTKHNPMGWVVSSLDNDDKIWLETINVNSKNVYRISSDRGTTLAKIRTKTGMIAFANNSHLEETDELIFDRFSAYSELFVDYHCAINFDLF